MRDFFSESLRGTEKECRRLEEIANDEDRRNSVIEWLDQSVLGRKLTQTDRTLGTLGFPGRHGAVKRVALSEPRPASLEGMEVRPVYLNSDQTVGAVFVGKYNGVGLFVDQTEINRILERSEVQASAFYSRHERMAVTCMELER